MRSVILAGGESRRMGQNKALLPIQGEPMIQRVLQICEEITDDQVVVANEPSLYKFLQTQVISDRYKGQGPLAGLEAAMFHFDEDWFMLAPCDSPSISSDVYKILISQRAGHDMVIPVFQGREHPLHGLYHRRCYDTVKNHLEIGSLRIRDLFEKHSTKFVDEFSNSVSPHKLEQHFMNLNHPEDYNQWMKTK